MDTKYTPGPWKVHGNFGPNDNIEVLRYDDILVALVDHGKYSDISHEASVANAQLIASAPDLVEALEVACNMLDRYAERLFAEKNMRAGDEVEAITFPALAALAKARGE